MRKAMKILLAVDGSEASLAAVEEAARSPWPEGSVVRIVSVTDIPFRTQQWAMPMPTSCASPKLDSSAFSTTSLAFLTTKIIEIKI
jgi:nucleotide-binding universal stress UspA family protein